MNNQLISGGFGLLLLGFCLVKVETVWSKNALDKDIEIKVGIVQRFGSNPTDEMTVSGTEGNPLTLTFQGTNGKQETVQTNSIEIAADKVSLTKQELSERVVLGDHATFETAEDDARRWKKLGIEVEITQPGRWQVWAKRDVYQTPLLRRWLLESLQSKGYDNIYLDTTVLSEKPTVYLVVNGKRYNPKEGKITAGNGLVWVASTDKKNLYAGSLKLQPNAYGTFTLINEVPLEIYLRGVVPHEIGPDAPPNAAQAQAIIARTYALRNLRRFAADNYELCADTHCQVYYGLTGTNPKSDKAIASTKSLVLTYKNELVDALYSSTTGGVTARFGDIWDGEERPYLKAVIDAPSPVWDLSKHSLSQEEYFRKFISLNQGFNETGINVFRWNKDSTLEELSKDLQKYLERRKHPLAKFNKIVGMQITKRSPSGRILEMQIQTDLGLVTLYKTEVRSAFGPPRSTLFYIEPIYAPDKTLKGYSFIGGGFGHGVGLSQYGSYNLAKLGWSAEKILLFYYPGTKIIPLDDSIVFWPGQKE